MRPGSVRSRLLLAALLPVTLLAVLMAVVFVTVRVIDLEELHDQQFRSLARQLATASEYGLFSGNIVQLEVIAKGALLEADVQAVTILDAQSRRVIVVGKSSFLTHPTAGVRESLHLDNASGIDRVLQPVMETQVKLDDLFALDQGEDMRVPQVLGHVVIEFSHRSMHQRARNMVLVSGMVALGGLLFGYFLALLLGRGLIRPIDRVSDMIARIASGDLSARGEVLPHDPLRNVQQGLNQMAERLESGRDELDQRIATATLALRQKKEEAEAATLAKSRFLAAASHDLRQPTQALGLFVARLAQLSHPASTRQLVGHLEASVQALQDLLDGLLDLSRLDANAVQVQLRPFALADIFDPIRVSLTSVAADKGVRLRVRPTEVWVMSDPALLQRIVLNLASNAVRYTEKGGVLVACRLTGGGQQVRIEVWDSGVGIAPEHHEAIFTEFYQIGNRERDRSKGMGLGLNIVERTARLLGHKLQMGSRLGRGTRFCLEVPLVAPGTAAAQPVQPENRTFDDLGGILVLVIEDDALAREGMVSLLESWDCNVWVADGLSAALRGLNAGLVPGLIVSDYRLRGGENGIDTISAVRLACGRAVPACLISGDTDPTVIRQANAAGLTLLHKPVRPAKLRSLVRRLADLRVQGGGVDLM